MMRHRAFARPRDARPAAFLAVVVLALAVAGVGCPCVNTVVNDSPGLRWWLFSNFAASRVCPEMLKRGVPLKLALLGPNSVGRYFPQQCGVHVDDNTRTMRVDVTGAGYAVLPLAKRVGFYCGVSVEFSPDFHVNDDAIYVWGRFNRVLAPPDLRLLGVESPVVSLATQTPLGNVATVLGRSIVESELARGFTVVRLSDGDDFTLGILQPPARPKRQFQTGSDRVLLASDRTEVHAASRDYLGPFAIEQSGAALSVVLSVAGAGTDYVVVDKATGDAWLQPYEAAQPIGPPPAQPIAFGDAPPGETRRTFPLDPGAYYVVIENRAPAPAGPLGMPMPFEPVAVVSYNVEVGSR